MQLEVCIYSLGRQLIEKGHWIQLGKPSGKTRAVTSTTDVETVTDAFRHMYHH